MLEQLIRVAKIHKKTVERFVQDVPIEYSLPIISDIEFEWIVRDLA